MSSIRRTLRALDPPDLASLCPRLAWVADDERPTPTPEERVCWRGWALVRVHGAVGADDGRPLRASSDPNARLLAIAAGAGPVVVTDRRVVGVLDATADRAALRVDLAWDEVDDVSPAPSGGVLLASTALLGGLTLDPVGS
jgi:hypothetical protein